MPWVRGLIFTALVPGVVGFIVPRRLAYGAPRFSAGWILIAAGALIYCLCLIRFLAAGGTPAPFFTRRLGFLIGEEPGSLVSGGLYRYSRNPMYVGVLMAIFGQAALFGSGAVAVYGLMAFLCFHIVVVLAEEPHLERLMGEPYRQYCRRVPRWLGRGWSESLTSC